MTFDQIFTIYGTHCLTGIILGGRLEYNVSAETKDLAGGHSIGAYAEASFSKGGVSIGGNTEIIDEEEYSIFMSSFRKKLHIYGGHSEFGQDIINENDYNAWINSLDANSTFCNFTEQGLIPVWEFVDDPVRKNELAEAYKTWASDHKIIVNPAPKFCILDVKVFSGLNVADPLPIGDRIYHRLGINVNSPFHEHLNDYEYIYYLTGYTNDTVFTPLAEIAIVDETEGHYVTELPGAGWEKLPENLNYHVGGQHQLYLCHRRNTGPLDYLITGIHGEVYETTTHAYSEHSDAYNNWIPILIDYSGTKKQDLNEGAGGHYIYLYFTRDPIFP